MFVDEAGRLYDPDANSADAKLHEQVFKDICEGSKRESQ